MKIKALLLVLIAGCTVAAAQRSYSLGTDQPGASLHKPAAHMVDEDSFRQQMIYYTERVRTTISHHNMTQDLTLEELLDRLKSGRSLSLLLMDDVLDNLSMTTKALDQSKCSMQAPMFEELRCALLVQLVVPLDMQLRKMVFEILDNVHYAIKYWQQQQQYPLHYFFHKSPLKVFTGQQQHREIEDKLFFLRGVQKSMFEFLGKWTLQITQFNQAGTAKEQYEWLIRLLAIPYVLIHGEQLEIATMGNYEKAMPVLRDFALKIGAYLHKVDVLIDTAQIPNYFERNWLRYTIAGLGAGIAGLYAYKHKEQIPIIFNNFRDTIYSNFVKTPTEALCDAFPFLKPFIGKGLPVEPQKPADAPKEPTLEDRAAAVSDAFAQVIGKVQGNAAPIPGVPPAAMTDEQLQKSYVQAVEEYFASRPGGHSRVVGNKAYSKEDVQANAAQFDHGLITQLFNQCFSEDLPQGGGWANLGGLKTYKPSLVAGISLLNIYVQIMNRGGEHAVHDLRTHLQPRLAEFLNATAQESGNLIDQIKRILKQNQVTVSFLACIPIAVLAYGGAKGLGSLYRWWMYKDYNTMRQTLISIAHLLNLYEDIHPQQMRIEHFGELLYLGHRLKNEKRKVPQEMRQQFMLDIERLEGNMSAQKKLYVIDLMYKSYPFLSYAK